jgi:putative transposase
MRAYKFRIYPSKKQIQKLVNQLELCCELHNTLLEKCKKAYTNGKSHLNNKPQLNKLIKEIKNKNPKFKSIYAQVLQNTRDRLIKTYSAFFRRVEEKKKGKKVKVGFPRFKKFYKSITYPQNGFKFKNGRRLHVSKIGSIPIVLHRMLDGKIKTLTIKRNPASQWFAIFSCEVDMPKQQNSLSDKKIGIDVGLDSFATLSDGTKIKNPRFLIKSEKRLKKYQRKLSRKTKASRNRIKARLKVAKVHNYLANQRIDFLHKTSKNIVNGYGFIAVEKLQIKNMVKNHYIAKSIADASWYNFIKMLCYKAESAGAEFIEVDPRGTSQICSKCSKEVEKSLAIRIHKCSYCKLEIDRDLNSAINILKKATAGRAESYACGDMTSTSCLEQKASQFKEAGTKRHEIGAGSSLIYE